MEYTQGSVGRIFVLRFQHGEDVLKELEGWAAKEQVHAAALMFLGALEKATVVAGPKRTVVPPQPWVRPLRDGWEWLGGGTLFSTAAGESKWHVHGAWGRGPKTLTGCLRQESRVFLMVEAVVWELTGIQAEKTLDPASGVTALRILGPGTARPGSVAAQGRKPADKKITPKKKAS